MSTSGKQRQRVNPKKASGGVLPAKLSDISKHGIGELQLVGEDPKIIVWYVSVLEAFASLGHSGGSAEYTAGVLNRLFRYENLSPLTDNPNEWVKVGDSLWQSIRNYDAFSNNGGQTYKLVSENNDVEHKTLTLEDENVKS
jgi:hypothetical protein